MKALTRSRAQRLLAAMQERRVLVVGDVMLDEFLWGRVARISPEAPVPVVEITAQTFHLGGAANVACNVRSLGGRAVVAGRGGPRRRGRSPARRARARRGRGRADPRRRRPSHHPQDADHRPPPAGGAGGPRGNGRDRHRARGRAGRRLAASRARRGRDHPLRLPEGRGHAPPDEEGAGRGPPRGRAAPRRSEGPALRAVPRGGGGDPEPDGGGAGHRRAHPRCRLASTRRGGGS